MPKSPPSPADETPEQPAPKKAAGRKKSAGTEPAPASEAKPARTSTKKASAQAADAQPKKPAARRATRKKPVEISHEDIARRAHELFERRGGQHGFHLEDWYEAERQLREEAARG